MFFVISLDPPIKQGQTRYHFLVLLFNMEDETSIELPFTEDELKNKYENKLEKELSGPVYEVLGKVMKVIINRKLTGPGNFIGHSGTPAVGCSYKATAGYIYPLERGFIYVHKPPIHIRFEEIASVNFARSGGSTRSFDFEIELKSGNIYTFSSIEKEEYGKLYDFISSKKLNIKNTGKNDKASYRDDFGDSDAENEPDAYLARVKAEANERESDDGESEDESTDEDFNPVEAESDVAEEYDSNAQSSGSESKSGDSDGNEKRSKKEKKRKEKPKASSSSKSKKSKKANKDSDAPKRPTTAFMLWLNETREQIKKDNPGISVTEVAKKGGEIWKEMKDKSKWEAKSAKAKEDYNEAMKEYKAKGGASETKETGEKRKKEHKTPTKSPGGSGFKSKEYISDDESSDSNKEQGSKKKKAKVIKF